MTHNGLPASGDRPQSDDAVALVKQIKRLEGRVLRMLDELADRPDVDKRRLSWGRTDIEDGFTSIDLAIDRLGRAEPQDAAVAAATLDQHWAIAKTDEAGTRLYFAPHPDEGRSNWSEDIDAALRLSRDEDARALALVITTNDPAAALDIVEITRPRR